ncbi:MAG: nucleotidyltransferase domain-containing protein [Lachnoclostridium sp.]|nr:nucleotidyltransferase domain-containing protein [Lachnospira sp.]MCM1247706.1 nucleotidyltransferase domain-containing protein [Lachnoclostridium sp.]MCM1536377.1 nucleotidyltransferase domain-containing protein [Clostridium sp.]
MSDVIYTINQLKEKLIPVFIDNSIRRAILFGSYGKGSATKESDIDLLVDSDLKGLRFVGLIEAIRTAVDKDVDIFDITHVEKGSKIDLEIQKTGVLMYEK